MSEEKPQKNYLDHGEMNHPEQPGDAIPKAWVEFKAKYSPQYEDFIRVIHEDTLDVRAWFGNDFFTEGFLAGVEWARKTEGR
jgi:hypothetical protein